MTTSTSTTVTSRRRSRRCPRSILCSEAPGRRCSEDLDTCSSPPCWAGRCPAGPSSAPSSPSSPDSPSWYTDWATDRPGATARTRAPSSDPVGQGLAQEPVGVASASQVSRSDQASIRTKLAHHDRGVGSVLTASQPAVESRSDLFEQQVSRVRYATAKHEAARVEYRRQIG